MGAAPAHSENNKSNRVPGLRIVTVATMTAALAACATTPPPPPPAPPPPPPPPPPAVVEATPYRPLPPQGAAYVMKIPAMGPDGKRMTVNRGLTEDETVWHFRSGWNVAALNCTASQYAPINTAYTAYARDFSSDLNRVNSRIEATYSRQFSSRRATIQAREKVMTSVYNFFALPPARASFCRTALDLSNRYLATPPSDPIAFGLANLATLEAPFDAFFLEYERYERESAAWDAKWGAMFGPSQPGWVAVQQARRAGTIPSADGADPTTTVSTPTAAATTVVDPDTGAEIPVVPVNEGFVSQPVVEPIATDRDDAGNSTMVGPTDDGSQ